jgi:hypothetical protein
MSVYPAAGYAEDLRRSSEAVRFVKSAQQAVELAQTHWWESLAVDDAAWLQLNQEFLCMPFDTFADSVGVLLDRPVFTHEFADPKSLIAEAIAKYGQEALP